MEIEFLNWIWFDIEGKWNFYFFTINIKLLKTVCSITGVLV